MDRKVCRYEGHAVLEIRFSSVRIGATEGYEGSQLGKVLLSVF